MDHDTVRVDLEDGGTDLVSDELCLGAGLDGRDVDGA